MSSTIRKLEKEHWRRYFDRFTERFLRERRPEYATIEVLTPEMGVQIESQTKPMVGLTYDAGDDALEVAFPEFVHRIYHPKEIHVAEDEEGWITGLKVVVEAVNFGLRRGREEVLTFKPSLGYKALLEHGSAAR